MVSIITVCYNAEHEIERTIRSVLMQTSRNYEYIFIDGASTDRTLDIIEQYIPKFKEKDICVSIVSEKDDGIYDAMNKGIKLAKGEWINLMNAGDCYHDAKVLNQIEQYCTRQVDIVVGEIVYVEGYLGKRYYHSNIENLKDDMVFCHQAVFASRKLFDEKKFDITYRYSADYDWLLYMYLKGYQYQCVDVLVVDYDSQGVSNQNRERTIEEAEKIRLKNGIIRNNPIIDSKEKINWKYKIYKIISQNKCLAKIYYNACGKNRDDTYWMGRRKNDG